jgi:hypothetical protein
MFGCTDTIIIATFALQMSVFHSPLSFVMGQRGLILLHMQSTLCALHALSMTMVYCSVCVQGHVSKGGNYLRCGVKIIIFSLFCGHAPINKKLRNENQIEKIILKPHWVISELVLTPVFSVHFVQ